MNYTQEKNIVMIETQSQRLYFYVLSDTCILKTSNPNYKSYSVDCKSIYLDFTVSKKEDSIEICTKKVSMMIHPHFDMEITYLGKKVIQSNYPFIEDTTDLEALEIKKLEGHRTEMVEEYPRLESITLEKEDCIYGLGDKTGFMNKRYYEYTNWNTDDPTVHAENYGSLYKSIPFFMVHSDTRNFGIFFDSTYKSKFDFCKRDPNQILFGDTKGSIEVYYLLGDSMKEILKEYTSLTGRCHLPQMWTLGYHQCRWGYKTEDMAKDIVKGMRENHIPFDCIYLDIDYMDHYKVFTVGDKFPNFKQMEEDFKKQNVHTVCIIDPGVKKEDGYFMYEQGVKQGMFATMDGEIYVNRVWPGDSVYPNFNLEKVREWWKASTHKLTDLGVDGIWNDMNEPASFNGPLPNEVEFPNEERMCTHEEIHNVYGHLMSIPTYNGLKETGKRPFVITRACYAGTQKYSTAWTGDNHSIWPHLQMMIPQVCNLGMSGMPFVGTDIGGFGGDCTKELLIRWTEAAMFSPLFRNHSSANTRNQEPFAFDQETIDITRKFISLRYEFLPYIYDLFYSMQETGLPVMRPMVLEFPHDKEVTQISDQFMVGESIMVAPILEQGKTDRIVYLPEGIWYDYFTKERIEGGKRMMVHAELDMCPIYVKENSILVKYPVKEYTEISDTLIVEVYGDTAEYMHYTDDLESFRYEKGEYNLMKLSYHSGKEKIEYMHKGFKEYQNIYWHKI